MSNVHSIEKRRTLQDQRAIVASEWAAKIDRGLSDDEAEALAAWVRADPENEAELLKMARLWDRMDSLARLSDMFPHAANSSAKRSRAPVYRVGSFAAAFVGIAGILILGTLLRQQSLQPPGDNFGLTAYETAVGSVSTVDLQDGSQITMNTASRVSVKFSQQQRQVQLERGEMHIKVARDPARPLTVVAAGRTIEAIGTAFSVRVDSAQRVVEVLVDEGRVQVGLHDPVGADPLSTEKQRPDNLQRIFVAQSERVILNDGEELVEVLELEDIDAHLSWRDGNLIFRGEPLSEAIAEVSRYTQLDIVIADERLKAVRIAGLFKAGDVAGFLSSLGANFDIAYEYGDDEIILLPAETQSAQSAPD